MKSLIGSVEYRCGQVALATCGDCGAIYEDPDTPHRADCPNEGVNLTVVRRVFEGSRANNDGGGKGKLSNPKDAAGDQRVPLWLLSSVAKIHWCMAQFGGMLKYGAWNWRKAGVRYSTYLSAMERHIEGIKAGEDFDPIDGTHHLGNIMACAAILLDARAADMLTDDRPPKVDHRPTVKWAELQMKALRQQYSDRNPQHYTIEDSDVKAGDPPAESDPQETSPAPTKEFRRDLPTRWG